MDPHCGKNWIRIRIETTADPQPKYGMQYQWWTFLENWFSAASAIRRKDCKRSLPKKLGTWEIWYQATQSQRLWNSAKSKKIQDKYCNRRLPWYPTAPLSEYLFFSGHVLPFRSSCPPLAVIKLVHIMERLGQGHLHSELDLYMRIQEALKHADATDPVPDADLDPQNCLAVI